MSNPSEPPTDNTNASLPTPPASGGLELVPLPDDKPRIETAETPAEPSPAELRKQQEEAAAAKMREVEAKRQQIVGRSQSLKHSTTSARIDAMPASNAGGDERIGDMHAQAGRLGPALTAYAKALTALAPNLRVPLERKIASVRARQRQQWLVRGGIAGALLISGGIGAMLLAPSVRPSAPLTVTIAPAPVLPADFAARIKALIARANDPNTPWADLEREARLLLPGALNLQPQVQQVLDQAIAATARINTAITALEATWWSDPAGTIAAAHALRRSEPRLSAADLARLPGAVRLRVCDPDGAPVPVHVDGHDLPARPEQLFCRHTDRATTVSAQAPGCDTWSITLAANGDASERLVETVLNEHPLWTTTLTRPMLVRWQGDLLLTVSESRCDAFDGRQGRPLTPLAATDLGRTTDVLRFDLLDGPGDRLLASTALGTWVLGTSAIGVTRTAWQDGTAVVLACVERPLMLRTGTLGYFQVERATLRSDSPVALVGRSAGHELWRAALTAELPAALAAGPESVAVIDDRSMRLFDQEGAVLRTVALPFSRISGPIHRIGGDGEGGAILLPDAQGVVPFVLMGDQGFVPGQTSLPFDADHIDTHGNTLAALDRDGNLVLGHWQTGACATLWTLAPPTGRHWAGRPTLGTEQLAMADDRGTLHLLNLSDHSTVRRISLDGSPLIPPTWNGRLVAVVDTNSRLNVYPWKR